MSIVTYLAVFFTMNPDEELTGQDIGQKWGIEPNNVGKTLRCAEEKGWISRTQKPDPSSPKKLLWHYTAGPRLLKEIGR